MPAKPKVKLKPPIQTVWKIRNTQTGEYLKFGYHSYWTRAGKWITNEITLLKAVEFLKTRSSEWEHCEILPYDFNATAVLPIKGFGE